MGKKSYFYPKNNLDIETEAVALFAEVLSVLLSIRSSSGNLDNQINGVKEFLAEDFKEVIDSVGESEKKAIISNCNRIAEEVKYIKRLFAV